MRYAFLGNRVISLRQSAGDCNLKIIDLKNKKETEKLSGQLCVALGNFDGVHKGHLKLIDCAVKEADISNCRSAVCTFEEHPANILSKDGIKLITSNEEKNDLFAENNLDYAIYEDFLSVKDYTPDEFIDKILVDKLNVRCVICGFNFTFGKDGKGNPSCLKERLAEKGKKVVIMPPFCIEDVVVSSTEIRKLIEDGKMSEAMQLLGRPYFVDLPVLHGKELGRKIGIPTINQKFPKNRVVPKNGIYCCKCLIGGKEYAGVSNVGSRPTVNSDENDINCETHIIGFNGWLYGENVKVTFYSRLRDEIRFNDIDELKEKVMGDIKAAEYYFGQVR